MLQRPLSTSEFFAHYIEGYLLGDLENMSKIQPDRITKLGGVCYPMVLSTLSGIEMLGTLLYPDSTDQGREDYFLHYWDNYLVKVDSQYENLGTLFYNLLRHSLAHTFLTKHGIGIWKKGNKSLLINLNSKDFKIIVDCNLFFRDFEKSYRQFVTPVINNDIEKLSLITLRLETLKSRFEADSLKYFNEFEKSLLEKNTKSLVNYQTEYNPNNTGVSI
ncbi:MAG TPA: hypothetical protein VHA74_03895 [Candidatus Dojkabacteria bacterium]|nr:hypothetical protein [Candidatus Dojkabacteria bacterium]